MLSQSIYAKLTRVRKPRVHITYDVETEGAVVQKELPFVVGVIGDFTGKPAQPLPPLKDRKFVQIDRDNFDEAMSRMRPGLSLKVENTLKGDNSEIAVELQFRSMDDFEPGAIAGQIPAIKALLDVRGKLQELLTKADRSEDLEALLERVLQNEGDLKELSADLEQDAAATAKSATATATTTNNNTTAPAAGAAVATAPAAGAAAAAPTTPAGAAPGSTPDQPSPDKKEKK
jgi:type VI secretion system protein ImpB